MNWTPTKRRVVLVIAPTALVAVAVLGVNLGKAALAARQSTPYSQSSMISYTKGQPLVVTIQNSLYSSTSTVLYTQVFSPTGSSLGYWAPLPNNSTTTGQSFTTVGSANMITVAFDTSNLMKTPPPSSKSGTPQAPVKSLPAPEHPTIIPVVTSGSTLCITTNVSGDSCPVSPIPIVVTGVTPCPPCP